MRENKKRGIRHNKYKQPYWKTKDEDCVFTLEAYLIVMSSVGNTSQGF